jgi:excinuclease ABC subunit B
MNFQVVSDYQPKATNRKPSQKLAQGIVDGDQFQTGLQDRKTFTVANVIQKYKDQH